MAKEKVIKDSSKKVIPQLVEKNLQSLLIKLYPEIGEKKFKKRIKRAGKILVRGINVKGTVTGNTIDMNEPIPSV